MSDELRNQQFQEDFKKGRNAAMTFGGLVYVGVVLAATTLFISFIMLAFPSDAYFTRAIMGIAGLLVGGSMIAFPFTLHNWAVSGLHRSVAIGLYYGEMLIIALNTVVSFASLLFKFANMTLPAWVAWYEPFSIISIVYTLFAWGTIFLLDPQIKAKSREHAALTRFNEKVSAKLDEFVESYEGEEVIAQAAMEKIQERFRTGVNAKKHFGMPKNDTKVQPRAGTLQLQQAMSWQCQQCGNQNANTVDACLKCGTLAPELAPVERKNGHKVNP